MTIQIHLDPSSSATSGRPRSEATRCKNRTVAVASSQYQWQKWHLWRYS
jgi:hypothetical protein